MSRMDWKRGEQRSVLTAHHLSGREKSTSGRNRILPLTCTLYPPDHTTSPWLRDALLLKAVIHLHDYQKGQNKHISPNRSYIYFADRKSIPFVLWRHVHLVEKHCTQVWQEKSKWSELNLHAGLGIKRNELSLTHSFDKFIAHAAIMLGKENTELKRINK